MAQKKKRRLICITPSTTSVKEILLQKVISIEDFVVLQGDMELSTT